MSRVTWLLIVLGVLAALIVLRWFLAPGGAALPDPSVSRDSKIEECDGEFKASYTVKNNLSIQATYDFTTSNDNNFNPNPPVVSPRNRIFTAGQAYSDVEVTGALIDPCADGKTTLHIEARGVGGVYNDFDNTFGPMSVEGDPPESKDDATPDFRYTFTLSCCPNVNGTFRIRDAVSQHIDNLRYTPDSINCPADGSKVVTVTGVLAQGRNSGVVDLGLRKDGGQKDCHLHTVVNRPREEGGA